MKSDSRHCEEQFHSMILAKRCDFTHQIIIFPGTGFVSFSVRQRGHLCLFESALLFGCLIVRRTAAINSVALGLARASHFAAGNVFVSLLSLGVSVYAFRLMKARPARFRNENSRYSWNA